MLRRFEPHQTAEAVRGVGEENSRGVLPADGRGESQGASRGDAHVRQAHLFDTQVSDRFRGLHYQRYV